jgi:hypothetical protein
MTASDAVIAIVKMVTAVIHVVIMIIGGKLPVSCVSVVVGCVRSIARRATTITSVIHIIVSWSAPVITFMLPHSICFHRRGIRRGHGVIVLVCVITVCAHPMPIAPALGAKIPVPAVVVTRCGEVRWNIIEAATLKAPPLKAVIKHGRGSSPWRSRVHVESQICCEGAKKIVGCCGFLGDEGLKSGD